MVEEPAVRLQLLQLLQPLPHLQTEMGRWQSANRPPEWHGRITSTPRPDGAASTSAAASAPLAPPDRRARRAFCAIRRGTAMFERKPALARTMLMSQRRFLEDRAATALGETPACAAA